MSVAKALSYLAHPDIAYFLIGPFLVVAALAVIVVGRNRRLEGRRQSELAVWASARNWLMYPPGTWPQLGGWRTRLIGLHPRQRDYGNVGLVLTGSHANRSVSVAYYTYVIHADQEYVEGVGPTFPIPVTVTVYVVQMQHEYPEVKILRRGGGSRLKRGLTERVGTEFGNAKFERRFQVSTLDTALARRFIGPALAQAFLAGGMHWLNLHDRDLMVTCKGKVGAARIAAALDTVCSIAELIEPLS